MKGTLTSRAQFQRVYEHGLKVFGPHVVVFSLRAAELADGRPDLQLGVVASRKVGDAVRRNRAKRLIREALRIHNPSLKRPQWLVIVARRSMSEEQVGCSQIRAELTELLIQLDALQVAPDVKMER